MCIDIVITMILTIIIFSMLATLYCCCVAAGQADEITKIQLDKKHTKETTDCE